MDIDKELNAVFEKVDAVILEVDVLVAKIGKEIGTMPMSADKLKPETAKVHTHDIQFRALSWRERGKLFFRFIGMAIGVLFTGHTRLKFKNRAKT
jgi:hypothetical protein